MNLRHRQAFGLSTTIDLLSGPFGDQSFWQRAWAAHSNVPREGAGICPRMWRSSPVHTCWALLRTTDVGRLAVVVDNHPDIFPLNYAVDHGTLVFRSGEGTKVASALSDIPVALEADGYDAATAKAWSVVVKGSAKAIRQIDDVLDTMDLSLFPWQGGDKNRFIRIEPGLVTGRRFAVVDPDIWRTPLSGVRRTSTE